MIAFVLAMLALAFAGRPLARYRARRRAALEQRRDSFNELLAKAESERIRRQVEAEGDAIPW